jgi:metal-responsive CopG/Arc/MetJ family transcriptional regulator
MYMKPIQVMFDEELLARLDADEEARRDGRSAVLRRAVAAYLRLKRSRRIAEAYERAYAGGGLEEGFAGWEREGRWPEK